MNLITFVRASLALILFLLLTGCSEEPSVPESGEINLPVDVVKPEVTQLEPHPELAQSEPLEEVNPFIDFEYSLGDMLDAYESAEATRGKMLKAIGEFREESMGLHLAITMFSRGTATESDLRNPERNLESFRKSLAGFKQNGDTIRTREYQWKVTNQELMLKVMRLQGAEPRAILKTELEDRLNVVENIIKKRSTPFNKRFKAFKSKNKDLETSIEQGMPQFLRISEEFESRLKLSPFMFNPGYDRGSVKWIDEDGRRAFSAFIKLRNQKEDAVLDGLYLEQYPYFNWTNWTMNLRVGYFEISFKVHDEDYKTKKGVAEAIELLFDLDSLTGLTPRTQ